MNARVARKRPLVHLTLSPDAIARLAEIATRSGETRSGVVERLIRECEMPRLKPAGQARELVPKMTPARSK